MASWEDSVSHVSSRRRSRIVCQRSSGRFSRHVSTTRSSERREECRRTGDRFRNILQDRADEARLARALESATAGQHLVENGAECEHVGAGVGLQAFELLRCHVLQRSEDGALLRQTRRCRRHHRRAVACEQRRHRLREAEVEKLRAAGREHDVRGFQVAVDDPRLMGLVQRIGNLDRMPQRALQRQRTFRERRRERLAIEVLHDEIGDAVLLADVVQRADMRVIELRNRPCLAVEPVTKLRIGRQRFREDLDGDGPVETRIAGLVDLAHAAFAQLVEDSIRAEFSTDHDRVLDGLRRDAYLK